MPDLIIEMMMHAITMRIITKLHSPWSTQLQDGGFNVVNNTFNMTIIMPID